MIDEDFISEMYKNLDFDDMKKRNEQITKKIRELLTENPQNKYLFAVGAGRFSLSLKLDEINSLI